MGRIYGYIRGLPGRQDVEGQMITLREMQVSEKDIFVDRQECSAGSREQYRNLFRKLKAGDLLFIKELGSLGDSYGEIAKEFRALTKEKKTDVVVLDMPQVDTRRGKTQCGTLVEDVALAMLEYAADAEWSVRKQRQKEGIERARSRGVQFGRPELPMPGNFEMAYRMWRGKEIKGREAAELCQISTALFYRRANQRREMEKREICITECGEEEKPVM